ncbi:MAG: tyrosine-protein phosphatase [Candidatus Coproplasma sp.]
MHIKRLPLKKLFNTRDLGGMPAAGGRRIVRGKLIRSGKLYKLPDETVEQLKAMGLKTVIDLRIFTEIDECPDTVIEGVEHVHLPVLCTVTPGITREKSMMRTMAIESRRIKREFGNADNYMIAMYKNILLEDEPVELLKKCMRLIIDNDGCILWHCSGGKDRAGIVAMLVESLLGVDEKIIIEDFVASHRFQRLKFFWNRFGLVIAPLVPRFKKILFGMMAAKPAYITKTMDYLKENFGSVTEYCKKKLCVTDSDIEILQRKYLEPCV